MISIGPLPGCYSRRAAAGLLLCLSLLASSTTESAVDGTDAQVAAIMGRIATLEDDGRHGEAVSLYEELLQQGAIDSTLVHGFARTLIVVGDHQRLVDLLSGWLRDNPRDIEAHVRLGRALSQLGRGSEAVDRWRTAVAVEPHNTRLYRQISNLCAAAGMHEAAIDILLDGRKDLGHDTVFSWELGSLYLREETYERAVVEYFLHLRSNPRRYAAVENRLASIAADSAQSEQLLQALKKRRHKTDSAEMVLLESVCLLEAGDPASGLELLTEVADRETDLLYRYATRCQALGQDQVAADAYTLFVQGDQSSPHRYRALLQLAAVRGRLGEYEAATEVYSRLASEYPGRREAEEALYELGRLQLEIQGDAKRAAKSLTAVIDSSPRGPWAGAAMTLLAECALALDDLERSDAYLTQLLQLEGSAASVVHYRRAELSFFRGEFAAAASQLANLLESDAGHELANDALDLTLLIESASSAAPALQAYALCRLRLRQRRPDAAAEQWRGMKEYASPDLRQRSLLLLANYHQGLEENGKALELYHELVQLFPHGEHALEAYLGSARIHEQQGRNRRALRAYETALLAFPEDVRAPEIRLQVDRLRQLASKRRRG